MIHWEYDNHTSATNVSNITSISPISLKFLTHISSKLRSYFNHFNMGKLWEPDHPPSYQYSLNFEWLTFWFYALIQRSARVSMESRYRHLLPSLDWSRSRHPLNFPVSMSLDLDIQEIFQSWWVLVLTSKKFSSLDESQYQWASVLTSTKYQSLVYSWGKEKPNKRNLTKLDKLYKYLLIY